MRIGSNQHPLPPPEIGITVEEQFDFLNGELVGGLPFKVQLAVDPQHAAVLPDLKVPRLVPADDGVTDVSVRSGIPVRSYGLQYILT